MLCEMAREFVVEGLRDFKTFSQNSRAFVPHKRLAGKKTGKLQNKTSVI